MVTVPPVIALAGTVNAAPCANAAVSNVGATSIPDLTSDNDRTEVIGTAYPDNELLVALATETRLGLYPSAIAVSATPPLNELYSRAPY